MLKKIIIPCLDCKDGRVVKGVKFQNLIDAGSPSQLSKQYQLDGADEIVMLDIGASIESREIQINTVREIRSQLSIPLTVGGGVRNLSNIETLLKAGADRVSLNSAAVENPKLIEDSAKEFGSQCIVVAIDAKQKDVDWIVVTKSGSKEQKLYVEEWIKQIEQLGGGEILLTSFDRDGTKSGYDLNLLRKAALSSKLPVIASGGARTSQDLYDAFNVGAAAVLAASIFHFDLTSVSQIKNELKNLGVPIRI
jgi:imidazoleglycerol phosphate synthase cyclase subunit